MKHTRGLYPTTLSPFHTFTISIRSNTIIGYSQNRVRSCSKCKLVEPTRLSYGATRVSYDVHTPLIRLYAFFIRLSTISIHPSYGATRCPYVCHTVERDAHAMRSSTHDCHTPEHVRHTPKHDVHRTFIRFWVSSTDRRWAGSG